MSGRDVAVTRWRTDAMTRRGRVGGTADSHRPSRASRMLAGILGGWTVGRRRLRAAVPPWRTPCGRGRSRLAG